MRIPTRLATILTVLMLTAIVVPGQGQSPGDTMDCDGDGEEDDVWFGPNDYDPDDPEAGSCYQDGAETTEAPNEQCADTENPDGEFPDCLEEDTTFPGRVHNIGFEAIGLTKFTVTWDPPTEDTEDVASYNVYHHTSAFTNKSHATAITGVEETTYTLTGLEEDTEYFVTVTAVDDAGNEGGFVTPVPSVKTPAPGIQLSTTSVSFPEEDEEGEFEYTIGVTGDIAEVKKVAIAIEVIDNNEALLDPIVVSAERVELSQSVPTMNVTVTFNDDDLGIGDRTYLIRHTVDVSKVGRDLRYDNVSAADLTFVLEENDVEPAIDLAGEAGLEISEGDGNVSFQVKLNREPTDDVFIHLNSSLPDRLPLITPHYLHFGIHDWDEYRTVTLHAVDNLDIDGDRPVTVTINVDPEGTAIEYAERALDRQILILLYDNEEDEDHDNILDSEDEDPKDRYNVDFRPSEFTHELARDGSAVRFSWVARHLDERISHYIIWEFSDPTNVADVPVVPGQRYYNHTIDFNPAEVHTYALQAVLLGDDQDRDGNYAYDEVAAVQLGATVYTKAYYYEVCGVAEPQGNETSRDLTNFTEEDSDGDGVCDAFEELAGTDPNETDTDGDGRTDYQELLEDGTDPSDPDSYSTLLPRWVSNVWIITGTLLLLASLVLTIVSFARRDDEE